MELFYRIQDQILYFFYYHKSAIKNKFKYGVYFGDCEAFNMEAHLNAFIVSRLKRLIDMNKELPTGITLPISIVEELELPKEWFTFKKDTAETNMDGWINILELIVEELEKEEKQQEDDTRVWLLLSLVHGYLWY